jgi:2-haloacid dehalogenase
MGYLPYPDIEAIDFGGNHAGTWNNCRCQYQLTEGGATSDTGHSLEGLVKSLVGFLTITETESAERGASRPLKVFVIDIDSPPGYRFRYLFIECKFSNGSFQTAGAACGFYDYGHPTRIVASNPYPSNPEYGVECSIDDLSYAPPPAPRPQQMTPDRAAVIQNSVKVLAFDVFGTVVDVRGSLIRELSAFGNLQHLMADWSAFADRWLAAYATGVAAVNSGQQPWQTVDVLNARALDNLLGEFGLHGVADEQKDLLRHAWRRLQPWPDAVAGLQHLRNRYRVITLANANFTLLSDLAASAKLPWDEILSAESVKRYKPDPAVYRMAVDCLRLPADAIMMVAAHKYDLEAAMKIGFRAAFVWRPLEFGPDGQPDQPTPGDPFDLVVNDFLALAGELAT